MVLSFAVSLHLLHVNPGIVHLQKHTDNVLPVIRHYMVCHVSIMRRITSGNGSYRSDYIRHIRGGGGGDIIF